MKIKTDKHGIYIERVVQGLNEESELVNIERNEFRGLTTIEEAQVYAQKWLSDRGLQEEIEILAPEWHNENHSICVWVDILIYSLTNKNKKYIQKHVMRRTIGSMSDRFIGLWFRVMYSILNCIAILCMRSISPDFVGRFVGAMLFGAWISHIQAIRQWVHGALSWLNHFLHGAK